MDFELSDEHEQFRKVVRDFAEREIAPHAEAWDRDHTLPVDTIHAMGELGLFGLPFPEEYGGGDSDFTPSASPSRSWAGSTSRSASRSPQGSGSASTRS